MKNKIIIATFMLGVGLLSGFLIGSKSPGVSAQTGTSLDGATLDMLYDAIFHRPADAPGRSFHLGRDFRQVLRDFGSSPEMTYYGALFKAVKAYEEAQRIPGTLTEAEKQSHLDLIDSALANLVAWVGTLPDQSACSATVGPVQARASVQAAYDRLTASGKTSAEFGLLNASRRIGPPGSLTVHPKCQVTPTPSPTATPSPSATPTPTPTSTATPTPTVTP